MVDACKHSPQVVKENNIKPNPLKSFGGLDGIPKGFEYMKVSISVTLIPIYEADPLTKQDGKVSGVKMTYKVAA